MTSSMEMRRIMEAVLARLERRSPLSDVALQGLRALFPDALILGALGLIDNDFVICYVLENARKQYIVQGSSAASYSVHPDLGCSCYAFIHGVLSSRTHMFCKHLLAVRIAMQMERILERNISEEDFAKLIKAQISP